MRTSLTSAVFAAVSALLLNSSLAQAQDTSSCIAGVGLIGLISFLISPSPKGGAPFNAVVRQTVDQKLADGNSIHAVIRYQVGRDASGKTFSRRPGPCFISDDGQQHQSYRVSVYDPNLKTTESWDVDGVNRIAIFTHMPPEKPSEAELAAMRANPARRRQVTSELQLEKLGTQNFQGVLAEGIRNTQTIPVGDQGNALPLIIVTENWNSTELGIAMKQVIDDPRRGRTVVEVEELNQGDPPPSIFMPPEGYEIKEQTITTTVLQSSPASR